jgi:ketosteroid isomerase-like protein/uncharacterized protein YuzE
MEEIREVLEARWAALAAGDIPGTLAYYAPSVVEFSLAPPLVYVRTDRDPRPLAEWVATFEAPPRRVITQLEITASDDVAFATSIDSMTATPKGETEEFTLWHRSTAGLRRIDGRWLITHEHDSVPFEMDGSLRASVDGYRAVMTDRRISFDPEADAAYLPLAEIRPGEAVRQVVVDDIPAEAEIVLDFSADGRLLGIEVIGATAILDPALLRNAER